MPSPRAAAKRLAAAGLSLAAPTLFKRPNLGQHHAYQRFVILSYQRSGSTLLNDLLNHHPHIVCYSEVLCGPFPMFYLDGFNHHAKGLKRYRRWAPDHFLNRLVFGGYTPDTQAVGFKLFPDHYAAYQDAFDRTLAQHPFKFIHLRRHNRLATYLSLARAEQTQVWSSNDQQAPQAEQAAPLSIRLDPAACLAFFQQREAEEHDFEQCFAGHPLLRLTYEELAEQREPTLHRVLEFLGLEPMPLETTLERQRSRSLGDAIANADELRDAFAGTPYAAYLDG
ncbi:MAG: sulfotransferase [Planctomycetota bacterium]